MIKTRSIQAAFQVPLIVLSLLRHIRKQQQFLQHHFSDALQSARNTNDGSLDDSDFKKITDYYGLAVPAILGEAICTLRGTKMTERERLALSYQGAMTGLFDDFFDKQDMPDEKLKTLIENPASLQGNNAAEKLFLFFFNQALQYAYDPASVLKYLQQVYAAQVESKKQAAPGLSKEEIQRITWQKGGVSVLFYRAALSHPFLPAEEAALYAMGGLMQLGNDVYDLYKDLLKGIQTLMTTAEKVNDVRVIFRKAMKESFSSFYKTGYQQHAIKKMLRLILMSLCSRCFVFFDQLEKKELSTGPVFSPHNYTRDELVCDMEKTSNKRKTILQYIRHAGYIYPGND